MTQTWTRPSGTVIEVQGRPVRKPAPAPTTNLGARLGDMLRDVLRRPQPKRRRLPPPDLDPAGSRLRRDADRLVAEALATPRGRAFLAQRADTFWEAFGAAARDVSVGLLEDRLAGLKRRHLAALGSPPTYSNERAVYSLGVEIGKVRRELAQARHLRDYEAAARTLRDETRTRGLRR